MNIKTIPNVEFFPDWETQYTFAVSTEDIAKTTRAEFADKAGVLSGMTGCFPALSDFVENISIWAMLKSWAYIFSNISGTNKAFLLIGTSKVRGIKINEIGFMDFDSDNRIKFLRAQYIDEKGRVAYIIRTPNWRDVVNE